MDLLGNDPFLLPPPIIFVTSESEKKGTPLVRVSLEVNRSHEWSIIHHVTPSLCRICLEFRDS